MALYKRGKKWWCQFKIDGKRYRLNTDRTDKRLAAEQERALRLKMERRANGHKDYDETKAKKIADLVGEYAKELGRLERSQGYVASQETRASRQLAGVSRLEDVTTETVTRTLARLAVDLKLSPKSQNDYRMALYSFFAWLVREGRWEANPVKAVPTVKVFEKT
ncbi:MAG TPA: hypothetical protein VFF73_41010, partial [Planctomycetota bacterium]|nr:hypothetical protein [Planctomycetota bacterium]